MSELYFQLECVHCNDSVRNLNQRPSVSLVGHMARVRGNLASRGAAYVLVPFFLVLSGFTYINIANSPDVRASARFVPVQGNETFLTDQVNVRRCEKPDGTVISYYPDPPKGYLWLSCGTSGLRSVNNTPPVAHQERHHGQRELLAVHGETLCRSDVVACKRQRIAEPVADSPAPATPSVAGTGHSLLSLEVHESAHPAHSATGDGDASQLMDVDTEETAAATISYGTASEAYMAEPGYIETLTLTLTLTAPATRTLTLSL